MIMLTGPLGHLQLEVELESRKLGPTLTELKSALASATGVPMRER